MNIFNLIEIAKKLDTDQSTPFSRTLISDLDRLKDFASANNEHKAFAEKIKNYVMEELQKTSWWFDLQYSTIKSLANGLSDYIKQLDKLIKPPTKKNLAALADQYNVIYRQTEEKFNGTVMLPIQQSKDLRGSSFGECVGYSQKAAFCFLNNKRFFNIDPAGEPPFKYSKAVSIYPDFNHLGRVTQQVSQLQNEQDDFGLKLEMVQAEADHLPESKMDPKHKMIHQVATSLRFFSSFQEITNRLIKGSDLAEDKDESAVFILRMQSHHTAHVMFFAKTPNGLYHLIDANHGWFRFNTKADFTTWFPFYLTHADADYQSSYLEYQIDAIIKTTDLQKSSNTITYSIGSELRDQMYLFAGIKWGCKTIATRLYEILHCPGSAKTPKFLTSERLHTKDDLSITSKKAPIKTKPFAQDDFELLHSKRARR